MWVEYVIQESLRGEDDTNKHIAEKHYDIQVGHLTGRAGGTSQFSLF